MVERRTWMAAWSSVALIACSESPTPVTQVVVLVGGPADIDTLDVSVLSANARNLVESRNIELVARAAGQARLPSSFVIVPGDPRYPEATPFRVVITGRTGGGERSVATARTAAIAGFSAGRTTLLPIVLNTGCDDVFCGCPADDDTCAQVCLPEELEPFAGCTAVPDYARLADVRPGDELNALARGAGGCAAGEVLGPRKTCVDLDECAFGLHDCDVAPFACENEVSGPYAYACRCPIGTQGDGVGELGCLDKP